MAKASHLRRPHLAAMRSSEHLALFLQRMKALEGRWILIVESDYLTAMNITDSLREAGAMVFGPVPDVEEAFAAVRDAKKMDLAVLDVQLGRRATALPISHQLTIAGIPFLYLTNVLLRHEHSQRGGAPVLIKPLDHLDLVATVSRLVDRGAAHIRK